MLKDHAWILRHVPQQGSMCLLDGVLDWDELRVRCISGRHRAPDNPLRAHGRLGAAAGIEFAAQAMAVHGALLAHGERQAPRAGYLAAVRGVELDVERLDDIDEDLIASAERQGGDATTVLYRFELRAGGRRLLAGRATVIIDPAALGAGPAKESR